MPSPETFCFALPIEPDHTALQIDRIPGSPRINLNHRKAIECNGPAARGAGRAHLFQAGSCGGGLAGTSIPLPLEEGHPNATQWRLELSVALGLFPVAATHSFANLEPSKDRIIHRNTSGVRPRMTWSGKL